MLNINKSSERKSPSKENERYTYLYKPDYFQSASKVKYRNYLQEVRERNDSEKRIKQLIEIDKLLK